MAMKKDNCSIGYPFFIWVIFSFFGAFWPIFSQFLGKKASFLCFFNIKVAVMINLAIS